MANTAHDAQLVGQELTEPRTQDHEGEGQRDQGADDEGQFDRQQTRLPHRPRFGNVVGHVQRFDHGGEAAGAGPEGAE